MAGVQFSLDCPLYNSSTNYLTTKMGMRQRYAFGTRIRISEEMMKTLKCTTCLVPFILSHISVNHRALVGNPSSGKYNIKFLADVNAKRI